MTSTRINVLESTIHELMGSLGLPGVSATLIECGALVWSRGFGMANRQEARPVTPDSIFEAGSLSKPVFACAILRLASQGVLELDAPLGDYLPEPYLPGEPRLPLITARRVLSHTCGLPNWRPEGKPLRMQLMPGTRFSYSGEGYVYLQKVVEHLTARPLAGLMQEIVLGHLGMSSSSYVWREEYEDRVAHGHDVTGSPVAKWRPVEANAAASLHTTPSDYARFVMALMQPPAEGEPFLSTELIAEMLRPHVLVSHPRSAHPRRPDGPVVLEDRVAWGLGWGLQRGEEGTCFWHWGDNGHCHAFVMARPSDGLGLVVMANSAQARRLWAPLYGELFGGEQPAISWLSRLYR